MYQGFAEIYDELMDDVDYEGWADYYARLLSIYGVREGKVCECACGTGGLTLPLYRRGYQMTGVDLSREMLWQAAQKARKDGIAMPFVQQDMKALNLHRPMDAVLATCDGVINSTVIWLFRNRGPVLYVPAGIITRPLSGQAKMAACRAAVSSVSPSPLAPKRFTFRVQYSFSVRKATVSSFSSPIQLSRVYSVSGHRSNSVQTERASSPHASPFSTSLWGARA